MVAAKFFEDQPCDNGYFATVGGVSVQEINNMELVFLDMLEYRVSITNFEFNLYASVVEAKADCLDKPRQHYMKEVGLHFFSLLHSKFIHTFSFAQAITPDTTASCIGLVIKPGPAIPASS